MALCMARCGYLICHEISTRSLNEEVIGSGWSSHLSDGWSVMPTSTVKSVCEGVPMHRARYCFWTCCCRNCRCIAATTSAAFANSTMPLVFMSSLCSGCGGRPAQSASAYGKVSKIFQKAFHAVTYQNEVCSLHRQV